MTTTVKLVEQIKTTSDGLKKVYLSKRYTTRGDKRRPTESLGKWLYAQPKSPEQKKHNKDVRALCDRIIREEQAKLDLDYNGLQDLKKARSSFKEAYDEFVADKGKRWGESERSSQKRMINLLMEFAPNLMVNQLNPTFSQRFYNFLYEQKKRDGITKVSANTANAYFKKYTYVAKYFWRQGLLSKDPILDIQTENDEKIQAPHLNENELALAFRTPMSNQSREVVRRAFLFSCFTGLRLGDLIALRYKNIHRELDGTYYVEIVMEKTKKKIKITLNENALEMIGEIREGNERVFRGINGNANQYGFLQKWMVGDCGVNKEITWHSGRHTFAYRYYRITRDIVALQHLLGHKDLSTTQIYAKHSTEDSKADLLNMPKL